jgi:hypothetical protein
MRFLLEVVVPYNGDDCLQWPYSRNKGYGQIVVNGASMGVHRYVCTLCHGEPPLPESQAAHSCGNGKLGCVNPKHLRWATIRENQLDRLEHGTDIRGEKHPRARLSIADVLDIRALKASGAKGIEIARKYGVTAANISQICSGKKWGWLEEGLENKLKSS